MSAPSGRRLAAPAAHTRLKLSRELMLRLSSALAGGQRRQVATAPQVAGAPPPAAHNCSTKAEPTPKPASGAAENNQVCSRQQDQLARQQARGGPTAAPFDFHRVAAAPHVAGEGTDFLVGGARLLPPPQAAPAAAVAPVAPLEVGGGGATRALAPNESKSVIPSDAESCLLARDAQQPPAPRESQADRSRFAQDARRRRRRRCGRRRGDAKPTPTEAAPPRGEQEAPPATTFQCDTRHKTAATSCGEGGQQAGGGRELSRSAAEAQTSASRRRRGRRRAAAVATPPSRDEQRNSRGRRNQKSGHAPADCLKWPAQLSVAFERRCFGPSRLVGGALLALLAALMLRQSLDGGHLLFASSATALQAQPTSGASETRDSQTREQDAEGGAARELRRQAQTNEQLSKAVLATMHTAGAGGGDGRHALPEQQGAWRPQQASQQEWPAPTAVALGRNVSQQALPPTTAEIEEAARPTQSPQASSRVERVLDFGRIFLMGAIIIGDICGNSLVILSVCRHTKLRVTTNWFVVSLACADILVALFAMTFNASVIISGKWLFNSWVCDFWNSCDVLASTASILHLCCISIDRYIAIMRPLDYPMKITTRRVVYALCAVWISSALLSYIPIFTGIYTTSEHIKWLEDNPDQCEFVVNRVYAIVSSSISFWIPCCIMVFTYYRIYREATRQEKFIYKAQSLMPAPMANHHSATSGGGGNAAAARRAKQRRSKSVAVGGSGAASGGGESRLKLIAKLGGGGGGGGAGRQADSESQATTRLGGRAPPLGPLAEKQPLASSALDINSAPAEAASSGNGNSAAGQPPPKPQDDDADSNSGQSTPTKRSISKMKREHKAAKTLGIIMGVFILCWLPFFSWYTPQHICGHACDGMVPPWAVTLLFWIGYFNSTLNPIIYAYFNSEFRDAFKKTLQWIFCCCNDLKCLRVSRPNDNQHYNCTYRSTQEIGLVSNS